MSCAKNPKTWIFITPPRSRSAGPAHGELPRAPCTGQCPGCRRPDHTGPWK
jgi:hypothetical protein